MTVDECADRMYSRCAEALRTRVYPGVTVKTAIMADLYALILTESERAAAIANADRAVTGDKPTAAGRIADAILATSPGKVGA